MFKQISLALGISVALLAGSAAHGAEKLLVQQDKGVPSVGRVVTGTPLPDGTPTYDYVIDLAGAVTYGGYTNASNTHWDGIDLGDGAVITGFSATGVFSTLNGSYGSEIIVSIEQTDGSDWCDWLLTGGDADEPVTNYAFDVDWDFVDDNDSSIADCAGNFTPEDGVFNAYLYEAFDDAGAAGQDSQFSQGTLTIHYYGGNPPEPTGEAEFGFGNGSIDFGDVEIGTVSAAQTATVTNTGDAAGDLPSFAVTGPGFAVSGGTCTAGAELDVDESCTIQVTFAPTAAGAATGELAFSTPARGTITTVALTGTGIEGTPGPGPGDVQPVVANVPANNAWTLGLLAGALGLLGAGLIRRRG